MRKRRRILIGIIGIVIGVGCLLGYAYVGHLVRNEIYLLTWKAILYIVAIPTTTVGVATLLYLIEQGIRGEEARKANFSDAFLWLGYGVFAGFQFYNIEIFLIRLVLGIILLILAIIFTASLGRAILFTALGRRRVSIFTGSFILLVVSILASWAVGNLDFIVFIFPLVFVLSISESMLSVHLGEFKSEKEGDKEGAENGENLKASIQILPNIKMNFTESFRRALFILPLICMLFIFFLKGIFPWPESLSKLSGISLTTYVIFVSIIVGFSFRELSRLKAESRSLIQPIMGLIQMCIIFIVISLVGNIIGGNIDITIFEEGSSLGSIMQSKSVLDNLFSIIQVIVLQIIALSFVPIVLYVYAMIKTLYSH